MSSLSLSCSTPAGVGAEEPVFLVHTQGEGRRALSHQESHMVQAEKNKARYDSSFPQTN